MERGKWNLWHVLTNIMKCQVCQFLWKYHFQFMITVSLNADVPWKVGVRAEKRKKVRMYASCLTVRPSSLPGKGPVLHYQKTHITSVIFTTHLLS